MSRANEDMREVKDSRISLKRQRLWRIVHEDLWRVLRAEIGKSGSCADRPKYC
jgi:hypothetical protein